ncbi:SpaA isopeptide-forming pilin-related protein [Microbacterium sp. LWH10-1.2]|uniref:SpaA isopeptide-forming pilin-related protein n=1 Tax=unclassified Microbacterium TaxID=2609290 RepID=UPI0031393819
MTRRRALVRSAISAFSVMMIVALAALGGQTSSAQAAIVAYEFTGAWENPPATVTSGSSSLSAVWRFDINDDSPAPSNAPVDNNVVTFVAQNATFTRLPDICLTSGVTPASSVSADGKTLVCNIGTRNLGTAQVAFTGLVPVGNSGDKVTVTGSFLGKTATLPEIPIDNKFVMDAKFDGGAKSTQSGTQQLLSFGWSLSHSTGSLPGPSSVSYDLTLSASNGETISLDGTGCAPIDTTYMGFPYSDATHAASQTTRFPTCSLTSLGAGKYRMTLSNLNYSGPFPTTDSTGAALPPGMDVIASGVVKFKFTYSSPGTFNLSATAPTYVAAGNPAVTSVDSAANNTNKMAYTRGVWTHGFVSIGALSQGTVWTDTYRTYAGATVTSNAGVAAKVGNAMCIALDTKYVTFNSAYMNDPDPSTPVTGVTYWYYTGTAGGLLDPASASYNPNAWTGCGSDAPALNGWTTTLPANLTTVKAVMVVQTQSMIDQGLTSSGGLISLRVDQTIKASTPVGMDVWSWGSYKLDGTWNSPNRSLNVADKPASGTATPGARYPYAAAGRDVLRIIGSTPLLEKEVVQKEAGPGSVVDYVLRYGLYSPAGTGNPAQVVVVDTLPIGLDYVAGSSTLTPVVSGTPATGVTLTWTIPNVTVNKSPLDVITFKASVPASATPGATYTNSATATSQGLSATASAQFVVPKAGYTTLTKTAASASVPSVNGVASDSWTVEMKSFDPVAAAKTDVVDILPYNGDGRGTLFNGTYALSGPVTAVAGATVYYTTAAPATLNEDPKDPSNGGFATVTGNTVGWTTTFTASATAVRVIGPSLAYGATQSFTVPVVTTGSEGSDTFVNLAVGRSSDTQLRMRTSAAFAVTPNPAVTLKKYVQDAAGAWHDAQDASDFPVFTVEDSPRYRIVVTNIGNVDLSDLPLTDDKADLAQLFDDGQLSHSVPLATDGAGGLTIPSLPVGGEAVVEYDLPLQGLVGESETLVNTACVAPGTGTTLPAEVCDPAGVRTLSSLSWNKIGPHLTTDFLAGSEWALVEVESDGGAPVAGAVESTVVDCVAASDADCTGADRDSRTGRFRVTALEDGWYRLTETKAPAGYALLSAPLFVYVDGTAVAGGAGIVNQLTEVPQIPLTGGVGSFSFWVAAVAMTVIAVGGIAWQRRRARRV